MNVPAGLLLIDAALHGDFPEVERLIGEGADTNYVVGGWTALISAAKEGHSQIVSLLLQHGANVNHMNNNGTTALIYAVMWNKCAVVNILLNNKANINAADKEGMTALMLATLFKRTAVVNELLDKGADAKAKNNNGDTALSFAIDPEIRKLLLKYWGE